jgi:hypothetical protein
MPIALTAFINERDAPRELASARQRLKDAVKS